VIVCSWISGCKSHFLYLVSYMSGTNIHYRFCPFVFVNFFCCTLPIYKVYCFEFSVLMLWLFPWLSCMFPFSNPPMLCALAAYFRHSRLGTINIFYHTPCSATSSEEFYNPFHCFHLQQCLGPRFLSTSQVHVLVKLCKYFLLTQDSFCILEVEEWILEKEITNWVQKCFFVKSLQQLY